MTPGLRSEDVPPPTGVRYVYQSALLDVSIYRRHGQCHLVSEYDSIHCGPFPYRAMLGDRLTLVRFVFSLYPEPVTATKSEQE
jgi:hypothetical protein